MTYKLAKTSQDADPYFGAVSLLLDGTDLQDKSLDTKAITTAGNAAVSTSQSKWNGSSLSFDGSISSYASTGYNSDLYIGTDVFTIECWFYANSTANATIAVAQSGAQSWATVGWYLQIYNGKVQLVASSGGGPRQITNLSTASITANTWHHVAAVKDVAAGGYYLYLDGVQNTLSTFAFSGNQLEYFSASTPPLVSLGAAGAGWNFGSFNGYLQDIRITKGVARYTATFTPPTQPFKQFQDRDPYFNNIELLLRGDGANASTNIVDSSSNPKTISVVGNTQISTAQSKFGGSSLYFDGTGDYLTATSGSYFTFGTDDFTVESWVWRDGTQKGYAAIAGTGGSTTTGTWSLNFEYDSVAANGNSTHKIEFIYAASGVLLTSTSAIADQTWTHVALARQSGVLRLFINGALEASSSTAAAITRTDFRIGVNRGGSIYFDGYIDDLRVTKGVARYTSNFTPTYQGTA